MAAEATAAEVAQCEGILEAAEKGLLRAVQHFLRKDAKGMGATDAQGCTPLLLATKEEHTAVVELLLARRAAVETVKDDGVGLGFR